jgi:PEP-CTERM motif
MHSLFKPIVAVLCLVFALCFAAPPAHADSITTGTVNFTVLKGGPTPTASFVFDNNLRGAFTGFSDFTVSWNGTLFDFSAGGELCGSNNAPADCFFCCANASLAELGQSGSWFAGTGQQAGGGGEGFAFFGFAATLPFEAAPTWTDPTATASGTYEVIITSVTPEPSSLALMLAGVGLVFAMRKRWASGLQQAS